MAEAALKVADEAAVFVEAVAQGYLEAADGNPSLALRRAARDVVEAEVRVLAAEQYVSKGFIRAPLSGRA